MTIESKLEELINVLGKLNTSLETIVYRESFVPVVETTPTTPTSFTPYTETKVVVAEEVKKTRKPKAVEPVAEETYDRPEINIVTLTMFAREKIAAANDSGERKQLVQAEIAKIGKAEGGSGDKITSLSQAGMVELESFLNTL